jgi:dTDP-4-amino-4,6-dideoxygalactose transaminase
MMSLDASVVIDNEIKKIFLSAPMIGEEEKRALCKVIDSEWITMGDMVAEFERSFADLHGLENAVAVSSCTAGLHLCLDAFNIGPGDEVMVPSLTFVATVAAVLYLGATPIFLDISGEDSPHISLEEAEKRCTGQTKAVVVMHYAGYPLDMRSWRSFCDAKKIFLIEDAAHSPGVPGVGKWSDAAAFSFFSNKNITTAEGGMVVAKNSTNLQCIRRLRAHGMTSDTLTRDKGHAYSYDVNMLGYNYRLDELRAAMGLVQLARLSEWNQKRRKLTDIYCEALNTHIPEITIPFSDEHHTAAHLMPVLLPFQTDRMRIMEQLRRVNIQTSIHYPPVHLFSYYRNKFPGIQLPKTESFCERELTLPLHPALTENDIDYVVQELKKALERHSG